MDVSMDGHQTGLEHIQTMKLMLAMPLTMVSNVFRGCRYVALMVSKTDIAVFTWLIALAPFSAAPGMGLLSDNLFCVSLRMVWVGLSSSDTWQDPQALEVHTTIYTHTTGGRGGSPLSFFTAASPGCNRSVFFSYLICDYITSYLIIRSILSAHLILQ